MVFGIRAVMEAVDAGKELEKVFIRKDLGGDLARELIEKLRVRTIPVQRVPQEKLNRLTQKNHQGVVAFAASIEYQHIEDIVPLLYEQGRTPLLVLLDGVTDVRNFGAIARTAECCGVDALIIPQRGSVSVGADAVKTSAGALHFLPVCREKNLAGAINFLKNAGYRVVAVSEKGNINYTEADYTVPTVLVMGAEDIGISPEVMRLCDSKVSIPMFGNIGSLNVSVAAGVLMYEVVRQRLNANMEPI